MFINNLSFCSNYDLGKSYTLVKYKTITIIN